MQETRYYSQERELNKPLCPYCKSGVRQGWNFCKHCGLSLNPAHAPQARERKKGTQAAGESSALVKGVLGVLVVGVLGLVGVFGSRLFLGSANTAKDNVVQRPGEVTDASPQAAETATPPPAEAAEAVPMVYISGGKFMMGSDGEDPAENPAHEVSVNPFFLDKYEVTCEQYQNFLTTTGRAMPDGWGTKHCAESGSSLPVTGVSWEEAEAFCVGVKKRLPSETEWEFAARGPNSLVFPWGNEWKEGAANLGRDGKEKVVAVGSHPAGASPFGVHDMLGNAWEWTATEFAAYQGGSLPETRRRSKAKRMVLRGGCFNNTGNITAAFRRGWPATGEEYAQTGLRCAKDADR